MRFYLTTNTNRCEPAHIKEKKYWHVKSRTDGNVTAVISAEDLSGDGVTEVSQEELQRTLDTWIDDENAVLLPDDGIQNKINLSFWLEVIARG